MGIYSLDINGNPTRFAPDIAEGHSLEFDSIGMFGNKLFVVGQEVVNGPRNIFQINPAGEAIKFTGTADIFTFGPDGAMYVHEHSNDIVTISKISPIPEPATVLLLGLGCLALRRCSGQALRSKRRATSV